MRYPVCKLTVQNSFVFTTTKNFLKIILCDPFINKCYEILDVDFFVKKIYGCIVT